MAVAPSLNGEIKRINSRHTNSHKSCSSASNVIPISRGKASLCLGIGTQFENHLANSNGDNICAGYSDFYFEDSLPSRVEWTKAKQSSDSSTFPIPAEASSTQYSANVQPLERPTRTRTRQTGRKIQGNVLHSSAQRKSS